MARRVTIQDIADELGLSRNTVSKALNNGNGLSDATRKRVIQKAMEMGYRQLLFVNEYLATQSTNTPSPRELDRNAPHEIALLSNNFLGGSHFASLMLDAFQNEISSLGYTLSMHRVSDNHIESMSLPITFRQERVAAIICFEMFNRAYDLMLCELGLPILFVDGPAKIDGYSLPADQLYMENYCGVTQLTNKLLAAGKTRLGYIGRHRDHCNSFYERYSAFRLAMLYAGLPVEERFCIAENKKLGIGAWLDTLDELPDAFLCANDFVALDALQALRDRGYDVPRDLWLAGFDDSSESRVSMPALTTVHIHTQTMAYTAVQLLRSRMSEPSLDYRTVYTETDLICRASTPFE